MFANCFLNKMENEVVNPAKPIFYRRYVDDTNIKKKKLDNTFYNSLTNFHQNLKFTTELNPKKFLDTSIHKLDNGTYDFRVVNKTNKMPFHWSSRVPIHYKRGVVKNELLRAKRISSNFEEEFRRILKTYTSASYPEYIIFNQLEIIESKFNDVIPTPDWLFNEIVTLHIRIPYCKKNEIVISK